MTNNLKMNLENPMNSENEIDLKRCLSFLIRNKKIISLFSFLFFVVASLYSLTTKRLWEGRFQILLDTNNSQTNLNLPENLRQASGLIAQKSNLSTQVGILESPSVLLPVFDFVKSIDEKEEKTFDSWKKYLNIKLKDNTSILNISYRDSNKEVILPVLKIITNQYQQYSSVNKNKKLEYKKNYLINEIDKFREKSANSLSNAQEFAIDNNLIEYPLVMSNPRISYSQDFSPKRSNIDYENNRVVISNEIKKIDNQLKKISQVKEKTIPLLYIASSIPELNNEGLPQRLTIIESDLAALKTKFTNEDETILRKIEERNILQNLIANKALQYLEAKKLELLSLLESAMRPKEVLLEYKKLIREAQRDEQTLINLENNLRLIRLEESIIDPPWKLITKPTLSSKPVSSQRKIIAFFGLITGFLVAILISFYREKKSDKIFDKKILENILSIEFSEFISQKDIESETNKFLLLCDLIKKKSIQNNKFISIGEISKDKLLKFQKKITKNIGNKNETNLILSLKDFSKINKNDIFYIITDINNIKYKEILNLKKYTNLFDLNIFGLIILKDV